MTTMLIDSGVDSVEDLAALLPAAVAKRFDWSEMAVPGTAAALRVLVTIRDEQWQDHVGGCFIDWEQMLRWVRAEYSTTDSVRVRVEVAASLAGFRDSQVVLLYAARALDASNFAAVMDALRIASQGVAR
jgi:hypothetical protein